MVPTGYPLLRYAVAVAEEIGRSLFFPAQATASRQHSPFARVIPPMNGPGGSRSRAGRGRRLADGRDR